jgi:hypothetical protein
MLLRRLLNMNLELYGKYPEFTEVDMTLKKLVETGIDEAIDKAVTKAVAETEVKAEKRGISQGLSQGISRTAKAMKASGEAIDKIRRYTRLSRREIMACDCLYLPPNAAVFYP